RRSHPLRYRRLIECLLERGSNHGVRCPDSTCASSVFHPPQLGSGSWSLSGACARAIVARFAPRIVSRRKAGSAMICRTELKRLQAHREYPSLSFLAAGHRTAPANKRDRIVVKNLVAEGLKRLHGEFGKRDAAGLVKNLNQLVARVDWQHVQDGLALFASRDE